MNFFVKLATMVFMAFGFATTPSVQNTAAVIQATAPLAPPTVITVDSIAAYIDQLNRQADALPDAPALALYSSTGNIKTASFNKYNAVDPTTTSDMVITVKNTSGKGVTYSATKGLSGVFTYKGGAYPGTGGTCGTIIISDCAVVVTFVPKGQTDTALGATLDAAGTAINYTAPFVLKYSLDGGIASSTILTLTGNSSPLPSLVFAYEDIWSKGTAVPLSSDPKFSFGSSLAGGMLKMTISLRAGIASDNPLYKSQDSLGLGLAAPAALKSVSFDTLPAGFSIVNSQECITKLTTKDLAQCQLTITYTPQSSAPTDATLTIRYSDGVSVRTLTRTLSGGGTYSLNPADNLLIVYNKKSEESVKIKDYYLAHRPAITGANVLGVDVSDAEIVDVPEFTNNLRKPVLAWFAAHPDKDIRSIVLMRGVPNRVGNGFSVDYLLSQKYGTDFVKYDCNKYEYGPMFSTRINLLNARYVQEHTQKCPASLTQPISEVGPFTSSAYPATLGLVTTLDMGSLDATTAYIDKLAGIYAKMRQPNVVISASNAGKAGSTYYIEDIRTVGYPEFGVNFRDALKAEKPNVPIVFADAGLTYWITDGKDVAGLFTWGSNGGRGKAWPVDRSHTVEGNKPLIFSGNSSWYLMTTMESYNGLRDGSGVQSSYPQWFSKTAFGSTNYENTPVGAVVTVDEPLVDGKNHAEYLACWEKGQPFAECAWTSRTSSTMMAVGDPWVRK